MNKPMELEILNKHTLPPVRTSGEKRELLTVNAQTGVIRFNHQAVVNLKMNPNSTFCIQRDRNRPKDFYIQVNPDSGGYEFQKHQKSMSLSTGHRGLAMRLLEACSPADGTVEIPIGPLDSQTGLYPLITSGAGPALTARRIAKRKTTSA